MSQKESKQHKSTKKRDRAQTEMQLMHAAVATLSKHGFNGTSTRMIAAKAKINESLIARYFGGKEGLLLAIVENFVKEICHEELSYPPQEDLYHELCQYFSAKLQSDTARAPIGKIIISHSLTDPKFHKKALTRIPMLEDEKFMERLQRLQKLNKIPQNENLKNLFFSIENYLHGIFLFEFLLNQTPIDELLPHTTRFARIFADGIESKL